MNETSKPIKTRAPRQKRISLSDLASRCASRSIERIIYATENNAGDLCNASMSLLFDRIIFGGAIGALCLLSNAKAYNRSAYTMQIYNITGVSIKDHGWFDTVIISCGRGEATHKYKLLIDYMDTESEKWA